MPPGESQISEAAALQAAVDTDQANNAPIPVDASAQRARARLKEPVTKEKTSPQKKKEAPTPGEFAEMTAKQLHETQQRLIGEKPELSAEDLTVMQQAMRKEVQAIQRVMQDKNLGPAVLTDWQKMLYAVAQQSIQGIDITTAPAEQVTKALEQFFREKTQSSNPSEEDRRAWRITGLQILKRQLVAEQLATGARIQVKSSEGKITTGGQRVESAIAGTTSPILDVDGRGGLGVIDWFRRKTGKGKNDPGFQLREAQRAERATQKANAQEKMYSVTEVTFDEARISYDPTRTINVNGTRTESIDAVQQAFLQSQSATSTLVVNERLADTSKAQIIGEVQKMHDTYVHTVRHLTGKALRTGIDLDFFYQGEHFRLPNTQAGEQFGSGVRNVSEIPVGVQGGMAALDNSLTELMGVVGKETAQKLQESRLTGSTLTNVTESISTLQERIKSESATEDYTQAVQDLEEKKAGQQKTIDQVNQYNKLQEEIAGGILDTEIVEIDTKLADMGLDKTVDQCRQDLSTIKQEVKRIESSIGVIRTQIASKDKEIFVVDAQMEAAQTEHVSNLQLESADDLLLGSHPDQKIDDIVQKLKVKTISDTDRSDLLRRKKELEDAKIRREKRSTYTTKLQALVNRKNIVLGEKSTLQAQIDDPTPGSPPTPSLREQLEDAQHEEVEVQAKLDKVKTPTDEGRALLARKKELKDQKAKKTAEIGELEKKLGIEKLKKDSGKKNKLAKMVEATDAEILRLSREIEALDPVDAADRAQLEALQLAQNYVFQAGKVKDIANRAAQHVEYSRGVSVTPEYTQQILAAEKMHPGIMPAYLQFVRVMGGDEVLKMDAKGRGEFRKVSSFATYEIFMQTVFKDPNRIAKLNSLTAIRGVGIDAVTLQSGAMYHPVFREESVQQELFQMMDESFFDEVMTEIERQATTTDPQTGLCELGRIPSQYAQEMKSISEVRERTNGIETQYKEAKKRLENIDQAAKESLMHGTDRRVALGIHETQYALAQAIVVENELNAGAYGPGLPEQLPPLHPADYPRILITVQSLIQELGVSQMSDLVDASGRPTAEYVAVKDKIRDSLRPIYDHKDNDTIIIELIRQGANVYDISPGDVQGYADLATSLNNAGFGTEFTEVVARVVGQIKLGQDIQPNERVFTTKSSLTSYGRKLESVLIQALPEKANEIHQFMTRGDTNLVQKIFDQAAQVQIPEYIYSPQTQNDMLSFATTIGVSSERQRYFSEGLRQVSLLRTGSIDATDLAPGSIIADTLNRFLSTAELDLIRNDPAQIAALETLIQNMQAEAQAGSIHEMQVQEYKTAGEKLGRSPQETYQVAAAIDAIKRIPGIDQIDLSNITKSDLSKLINGVPVRIILRQAFGAQFPGEQFSKDQMIAAVQEAMKVNSEPSKRAKAHTEVATQISEEIIMEAFMSGNGDATLKEQQLSHLVLTTLDTETIQHFSKALQSLHATNTPVTLDRLIAMLPKAIAPQVTLLKQLMSDSLDLATRPNIMTEPLSTTLNNVRIHAGTYNSQVLAASDEAIVSTFATMRDKAKEEARIQRFDAVFGELEGDKLAAVIALQDPRITREQAIAYQMEIEDRRAKRARVVTSAN